jgi:hypothetical protein
MIAGIYHKGSGTGNQLFRYVGTKILALEKGEEHTMIAPELFKGKDFLNLEIAPNNIRYTVEHPSGKVIPESYEGVVDGEFQNEADFVSHLDEIREWLKVEPLEMPEDVCVINFRGGEYVNVPDLFLPPEYWEEGIEMMREINPLMKFEVHTDDPDTAKTFFHDFPIIHNVGLNWRAIRYANYLLLSNSSFAILPAYLGDAKLIIAPLYWARYNTKEWLNPDNATYSKFKYI